MRNYEVYVNIKLKYEVKASSQEEALEIIEDKELPKEYVENSFEYDKIIRR